MIESRKTVYNFSYPSSSAAVVSGGYLSASATRNINAYIKNDRPKLITMNNYLKVILLLTLFVQACSKDEVEKVPSPEYPYTYEVLSKKDLDVELQKFNSINTIESLTLNEFGILSGSIPVNLSTGLDSTSVKANISMIINTYGSFIGIEKSVSLNISTDISIRLNGGIGVSLGDYFKYGLKAYPMFVLKQNKLKDRSMDNAEVSFYFSQTDNKMQILGRWYPEVYIPEEEIKNPDEALAISIQYIKENHNDVTPLNLANVETEKFNKILFPLQKENKIELRECWEVTFWNNFVKTLVDTQTGEVVYYLDYGGMI